MPRPARGVPPRHGLRAPGLLPTTFRDRDGAVSQPWEARQADSSAAQGRETAVSFAV